MQATVEIYPWGLVRWVEYGCEKAVRHFTWTTAQPIDFEAVSALTLLYCLRGTCKLRLGDGIELDLPAHCFERFVPNAVYTLCGQPDTEVLVINYHEHPRPSPFKIYGREASHACPGDRSHPG